MTAPSISSDGRRAGATWVAAAGAFLLLAAAAVFIAVRWDDLPDGAKLAIVGALTGVFLVTGRAVRRTLPATGDVVFHLGALLLPVDLAGVLVHAGVGWRGIVLGEGVLGVTVLAALARSTGSVVLTWAALASMGAVAAGVAGLTAAPAGLVLAAAAGAAHVAGWRRPAIVWAAAAGLAPVAGLAVATVLDAAGTSSGAGVLAELGLAGDRSAALALVSGAVAAAVLGRGAHVTRDVRLVVLAGISLATGAVTTGVAVELTTRDTMVALPAVFLCIELVALLVDRDPFWRAPARATAFVAEVAGGVVGGIMTLGLLVQAPIVETGLDLWSDAPGWRPDVAAGVALTLLVAAWLVAGLRRSPGTRLAGQPLVAVFGVPAALAAIEMVTVSTVAIALAMVAAAGLLVASRRPAGLVVAAGLGLWAPVVSIDREALALAVGLTAAAIVAEGATGAARRHPHPWSVGVPLALPALGVVVLAAALAPTGLGAVGRLAIAVAGCWLIGIRLDAGHRWLGDVGRAAAAAVALFGLTISAEEALAALALVTQLAALDAIRLRRVELGHAAAVAVQVLIVVAGEAAGLETGQVGLALCVGAVVWAGLTAVVDRPWQPPFVVAAVLGLGTGVLLATADERMLATAVILAGGLMIAAGAAIRQPALSQLGGGAVVAGIIGHVSVWKVESIEAYLAPVALYLVVLGEQARRRPDGPVLSSWVAHAPAVALLGGAAYIERLDGGSAWHALVAGTVAVVAIAAGGWRRLAAPLLLGTGLLVAVTVTESLAMLVGVPTWAWLAAGGVTLLTVGVVLERTDTSPVEAGRRVVDVVAERFD